MTVERSLSEKIKVVNFLCFLKCKEIACLLREDVLF